MRALDVCVCSRLCRSGCLCTPACQGSTNEQTRTQGALTNAPAALCVAAQVVLEALPPAVQAALDAHNSEALRVFIDYVRCHVDAADLGDTQQTLPLSGARVGGGVGAGLWERAESGGGDSAGASLQQQLAAQRIRFSVCSPYAALSGQGDVFGSMDELVLR